MSPLRDAYLSLDPVQRRALRGLAIHLALVAAVVWAVLYADLPEYVDVLLVFGLIVLLAGLGPGGPTKRDTDTWLWFNH